MRKNKGKLYELLLKNKKRIKKIEKKGGFYVISLLGFYSCGGDDEGLSLVSSSLEFTSGDDYKDYSREEDSYIIASLDGKDLIRTGKGSDVVRGGMGRDEVLTGAGDDIILLVGKTRVDEYEQEDVEDVLSLILNVDREGVEKDSLNNRYQSEAVEGEILDGGAGEDMLVVYGNVDMRVLETRNIEELRVYSELILTEEQLSGFKLVRGVGESYLSVEASGDVEVVEFNLEGLEDMSGIESLKIGVGVKLIVSSRLGLRILNSIGRVEGGGHLEYRAMLNAEGEIELTAWSLFNEVGDSYAEDFIRGEQLLIEGISLRKLIGERVESGLSSNVERRFAEYVEEKTVEEVFFLMEGEELVDVRGFSFGEGVRIVSGSSAGGFSFNGGGELVSIVRDYEAEEEKSYMVNFEDGGDRYYVKILLINVNEDAEITGDIEKSIIEGVEEQVVGSLSISDEDGAVEEFFFSEELEGEYGMLKILREGVWGYQLNKEDFRVEGLIEGESLIESLSVMSVGGTEQELRINIRGSGVLGDEVMDPRLELSLPEKGFIGEEISLRLSGEDLELLDGEDYIISWFRGEGEILGEDGESYTLVAADFGEEITVRLSYGRFEIRSSAVGEIFEKHFLPVVLLEGVNEEGGSFGSEC